MGGWGGQVECCTVLLATLSLRHQRLVGEGGVAGKGVSLGWWSALLPPPPPIEGKQGAGGGAGLGPTRLEGISCHQEG